MSEERKLTNEEIIEILKWVIERVNDYNDNKEIYPFICTRTKSSIRDKKKFSYESITITDYIPLFTYENAVKYTNADKFDSNDEIPYIWWDNYKERNARYTTQGRIQFLEWLIEQYSKKV